MITRSSEIASTYFNTQNGGLSRVSSDKQNSSTSKTAETKQLSRVEELKAQIANGEYKINLEATAKKMAQELI